jgi:DNA-binding transcriptional MerR regulator
MAAHAGAEDPVVPAGRATRGVLQIGDVAERTGLSLRTVRHYEEVGLLPPAERSPGGFRLYDDSAVQRLRVIKQMKPLEFTLEEMRELLEHLDELAAGPTPDRRREVQAVLRGYSVLVQARIATLQQRLTDARALLDGLERLA